MKFSRNPTTGELEVYTDDGMYVGVMSTMGDVSSPASSESVTPEAESV